MTFDARTAAQRAFRALRRVDDSISDCWLGHLIGATALFVLLFSMCIIVGALQ